MKEFQRRNAIELCTCLRLRLLLLLILFTLALSIVLRPRGHDMPHELSDSTGSAGARPALVLVA